MRRRFIYDKDMDAVVEVTHGSNAYEPERGRGEGLQIVSDIEPYRAVASDVALGGAAPVIGGRRQHGEFLRRNGYIETGNEVPITRGPELSGRADRIEAIRRAMGDYGSNTGARR